MTSAKIPEGSRTTRKRGTNRINFPKGIKMSISMKQMSIIVKFWTFLQFLFKCTTIFLDAYFQRKPKIIYVLQHICISGRED
jgi:uncharacterized membrane protein